MLVFRWLFIPYQWIQVEANTYVYNNNTSCRRANRQKIQPVEFTEDDTPLAFSSAVLMAGPI